VTAAPSTPLGDPPRRGHRSGPRRPGPTWRQFPHTQAAANLAAGSLHVDTVLLKQLHALAFTEHGTRRMHLGGVTASPASEWTWTVQQARNLAPTPGERPGDTRSPIYDRGPDVTASSDALSGRVQVTGPTQNPAYALCGR